MELGSERNDEIPQADLQVPGTYVWTSGFSPVEAYDSVIFLASCRQMSLQQAGEVVLCLIGNRICNQISLKVCDFSLLNERGWLNYEIVNAYLLLISEQSLRESCSSNPGCEGQGIEVVSSGFFVYKGRAERSKFLERLRCKNIFTLHMLMFPIHNRNHWILAVVNFREKQIAMYDSFRKSHLTKLKKLLAVLKEEAERLGEEVDFTCWTLVNGLSPKQSNYDDCGVFACTTAVHLAQNLPLDYTQENILLFRLKMARDLRRGSLDPKTAN